MRNIKYAFRNLKRDKFYSLLNAFGLTLGMTVALLIFMWIQDENSYDNYHSQNGQNYYVLGNMTLGETASWGIRTPAPLAAAVRENVPEVQHIARTYGIWKGVLKHENFILDVKNSFLIEPALFKILDFKFIQGDPSTALSDPSSIILTKDIASKIFGTENPMGKIVQLDGMENLVVTAIIKTPPQNTHLQVDCFVPLEKNIYQYNNDRNMHWRNFSYSTYLTLRPNVDAQKAGKLLSDLIPIKEDEPIEKRSFFELHPVQDIYLGLGKVKYGFPKGDRATIRLFGLIAMIILLIASINYINLTTARAAHRAKATGIRKIVGASRPQLIGQHILEAVCLVGICSLAALLLAQGVLPYFEEISGKKFLTSTILSPRSISIIGAIAFATILLSGIQPAFQLTAFRPTEILKGSAFKGREGKNGLRKMLVVSQFVGSAALIICTIFILRQMDFIQSTKLGYEKEHIFTFRHDTEKTNLFEESLKREAIIKDITYSDQAIVSITNSISGITWEGVSEPQDLQFFSIYAGSNFKDFFGLEMKEGRWFRKSANRDSTSFIINETAAKAMQLDEPVGKYIDLWGERGTIVGVVKDIYFQSFHEEIKPLLFTQRADWFPIMYVKASGENTAQAIAVAEKIYKEHSPNGIFKHEFLDETFNQLYTKESRAGTVFFLFAMIAIIISCLGVFGLATYTTEKRFKEIGIRKVLGASVISIVQLLTKDFLKLVLFAVVIAVPLAWYFMNGWLDNFAYHINLSWWVFAAACILAIVVALLTVGVQAIRAAVSNPAESIKSE